MVKMRRKRSVDELLKASDALFYELSMFNSLVRGMLSEIAGDSVINNALLESFAIHVRALLGFFYSDNRTHPDDIVADDFFADPTHWMSIRPAKTVILEKAHKRASKEIAHLTYARLKVKPEQKPWEYVPISNDLDKIIEGFLNVVPRDLLGNRWDDFKKAERKTV